MNLEGSLARLEKKIDSLGKGSAKEADKTAGTVHVPTQEELDEERLREIEPKIAELVGLLGERTNRDDAESKCATARQRVDSGQEEEAPYLRVWHKHGGKQFPTTRRTQSKMQLVEALKTRLQLASYTKDLEHALHMLVQEQLDIIERKIQTHASGKRKQQDT